MAKKANPRRYAQAVFEIALEEKSLDRWQADLQKLAVATGEASFLAVLENPGVKFEDKARLLKEIFRDISQPAMNLVLLLISRSKARLIPEVNAEYKRLLDEYRGIKSAVVTTAVPLDAKDIERLKTQLNTLTGAAVEIKTKVNPSILGGIIARVGGRLLDGSTRTKLAALKRELAGKD